MHFPIHRHGDLLRRYRVSYDRLADIWDDSTDMGVVLFVWSILPYHLPVTTRRASHWTVP